MKQQILTMQKCTLLSQDCKVNKKLLTIKEVCAYLGIGQTKARELIRGHNGFGVRIGNRWYADKNKLDKWVDMNSL